MSYHRIIDVPACQIKVGDVILIYPTSSGDFTVHSQLGLVSREKVTECHLDHADGEIYIKTANAASYCQPHVHIRLDCLETFGKNTGEKS